jgi:hypothetical protein
MLVAVVGASAHSGFSLNRLAGVHSAVLTDEATGARTESPEPSDSPEPTEAPKAAPTAEPAEAAEAPEAAGNDNEQGDNDTQGEDNAPAAQPKSSDEHDSGTSGGGDGEHG